MSTYSRVFENWFTKIGPIDCDREKGKRDKKNCCTTLGRVGNLRDCSAGVTVEAQSSDTETINVKNVIAVISRNTK